MKVPKSIADKVRQYTATKKQFEQLHEELTRFFSENGGDGVYMNDFFIADKPAGTQQNGDEFCDQWPGYIEDDYSGIYYHAIEGEEEYVAYSYQT